MPLECFTPLLRGKAKGRSKLRKGEAAVIIADDAANQLRLAQDFADHAQALLRQAGYARAAIGVAAAIQRLASWEGKVRAEVLDRRGS